MFRDGILKSIWQAEILREENDHLQSRGFDVVIAGAGISGLSCAINLQSAGLSCLVVEAENAGFGTTGGTTAHLNTFFDASYDKVIRDFGLEGAELLAKAGKEAIGIIRENISQLQDDCDFEEKTGFLFATKETHLERLEDIYNASNKVGVKMDYCDTIPFPVPFIKAVKIKGQAQFHPIRYIQGLRDKCIEKGGHYVRKCRVTGYKNQKDGLIIHTTLGDISAKNLIYATHTPPGVNLLHFRNIPWRSYVLGVELDETYPFALGYDMEELYHYYRSQFIDGKPYLIVGGEDHKTGATKDAERHFVKLEHHVRQHFKVRDIAYKWSSQYYEPVDGLPYIGQLPMASSGVYVCTGYNGNGMIFGTLAGRILSDLISYGDSPYRELFSPSRIKPAAGFKKFVSHNGKAVGSFLKNKLLPEGSDLQTLRENEGKIIRAGKKKYAVFKEPKGLLHALPDSCTHTGCALTWNNAEKSWDCSCHGSRFGIQGNILNAPATKSLSLQQLPPSSNSNLSQEP